MISNRKNKLILEESGGVLTDWNGNDIKSGMSNVVASNGKIHKQLLQYLA
ncbi:MAG: hypothetical protein PUB10_00070 [Clostridiales bacterium]|nr:hypothetical protein [Clostridiales bacterium]